MPLTTSRRKENKKSLGDLISNRRKELNVTQQELASKCGVKYYTMISQIELGYITCPEALWLPLGKVLYADNPHRFLFQCEREVFPEKWRDKYTFDGKTLSVDEVLERLQRP